MKSYLTKTNNLLGIFLCLVPIIISIIYVSIYSVNVPWTDQFNFIPLLEKPFFEVITSPQFYTQHNEHRIVFPRLIMLILAYITKYNVVTEMFFTQFLLLATLGITFLEFNLHFGKKVNLFWFVPISFLIFSLRQHLNMLFGFQLSQVSVLFFSVSTLYFIYLIINEIYPQKWRLIFWIAIVSTILASFSSAGGLFVWQIGGLQILLFWPYKLNKIKYSIIWGILGIFVWGLYFYNYQRLGQIPGPTFALNHPLVAIEYLFTYIGSSLFWHRDLAFLTGIILLPISLSTLFLIYKSGRTEINSFWLAFIALAYLTAFAAPIFRSELGVEQALESKYTTFSIPIVLSLYILLSDLLLYQNKTIVGILFGFVSCLMILGISTSYNDAIKYGIYTREIRSKMTYILFNYKNMPDELPTRADPDKVKNGAAILEKLNYSVFSTPEKFSPPDFAQLSPKGPKTAFSLDTIDREFVGYGTRDTLNYYLPQPVSIRVQKQHLTLRGWAVDITAQDVAGGVYLDINGKLYPAFYGIERKDIADLYNISNYRYSGFEIIIPISEVYTNPQKIVLKILSTNKNSYYEFQSEIPFVVE